MSVCIGQGSLFLLALCLRTVPLPWAAAGGLAALLHEGGHLLALVCCGGHLRRICLRPGGAVLETGGLGPLSAGLCALAGPACGLLLLPLYPRLPRLAVCGLTQSVFNLLPLPASDGALVAQLLCDRCLPPQQSLRLQQGLSLLCLTGLVALAFPAAALLPFPPAIIPILLIFKLRAGKNPCIYPL